MHADDDVAGATTPHGEVGPHGLPTVRGDLADLRLLKRAIDQGWEVPEAAKKLAVARMVGILRQGKCRSRAWTAAAKTLVSMTTATTGAIGTAIRAKQLEDVEDRLAELEKKLEGGQP